MFKPGKSPMLTFDMPYKIQDSKAKTTDIYVIAGGPCSGKTSILKALNEKGYETIPETAEQMIKARTSKEMDGTLSLKLHFLKIRGALIKPPRLDEGGWHRPYHYFLQTFTSLSNFEFQAAQTWAFFDEFQIFAALSRAQKKGMKNIKLGHTLSFLYV